MVYTLITFGLFFLLLLFGMPIAFTFFLSGLVGIMFFRGFDSAAALAGLSPFSESSNYILLAMPLFILMGQLIFYSGLSKDLYMATYRWLGRLRGGLAQATVVTCALFAACSGSSMASVGTIGPIAMSEMERYKYDNRLACGSIACAGTLGILIPPSIAFIVVGYICEIPVGPLFIAGILPGILLTLALMATILILCAINPKLGPPGPSFTFIEKLKSLKAFWWSVVIFIIILGGIYLGLFTPTEAAGMGAFAVFVILFIVRKMTWEILLDAIKDTVRISCMIFTIFIGAKVFNTFLALSGIPQLAMDALVQLPVRPSVIVLIILIAYVPLGCFIDSMPLALLTLPIVFPIIVRLGFDPLWFGVLHVIVGEISLVTPPVGMNVYVLSGVTGQSVEEIFRGTFPFLVAMIITMLLIFYFPEISTFLPNTMIN